MKTQTLVLLLAVSYISTIIAAYSFESLERGLNYYWTAGIFITTAIFLMPFFNVDWVFWKRLLLAAVLSVLNVLIWIVCFFLADYRLITRLF